MEGESTTDRLDLSWLRRWTYYRTVQSLLVSDQSHKIQLESLSRLILRLVNQETSGFGPRVSSHWSSRSWIPNTKRIHKLKNTTTHKVKPEALSQFDIEACVSERTYYRTVQIHCFEEKSTTERLILQSREMNLLHVSSIPWTRRQTYQRISLVLLGWLVMNYLFMTQSYHVVTSLNIVMFFYFEINMFAYTNVTVLVILQRASRCSCLDWLFWMLHYLCKNHRVTSHPFVWAYLITTKDNVSLSSRRHSVSLTQKIYQIFSKF
jgi:hypothetical protein